MSGIELRGIHKTYADGAEAVRDMTLSIGEGEFLVLVGPSGCGKSTTLRMIAGLEEVSRGTISIGNRVVNDVHPKDRDIAMVFQNFALYPHMTVRQNMAFGLRLRRMARGEIDRRVRETADALGLAEHLDRKPSVLSGGQRQRVALGRAIVREPRAFLFDEPLSNLDARLRVTTRTELKALHQRLRTTTVYVTHDQEEAMTLGDRIVVMARSAVQQVGTPFDVYASPANRFVAGFIGTPSTNFLEGSVEVRGGGAVFVERLEPTQSRETVVRVPGLADPTPIDAVTLGIRPQAVRHVADDEAPRDRDEVSVLVDLVEPLGEQMDVHGTTPGGRRVVFRVRSSTRIPVGAWGRFALELDRVHLFEPGEFGRCLTRAGSRDGHGPDRPSGETASNADSASGRGSAV